jgi:hypothetical protein
MRALLPLALLCLPLAAAWPASDPTVLPVPDPEREGRELATRLRTAVPEQDSEFKGRLVITTRDGQITEIPIRSKITVGKTNWQVVYHAAGHGQTPAETLTIIHAPGQPNLYQLSIDMMTGPGAVRILRRDELARPFAGSDFWALDLGLEFLQWPQQRKLKHEMRRNRSCNVLESVNPRPEGGTYARVVSWIDVETDGIIVAEAFDPENKNKPVKQFTLGTLRKVEGRHQLESMKIRSLRTGGETELKFVLQKK